ncbi:MAG: glycosyltransferase family 1 protein [Alphaproteobacteria bacterium]|nr:MAG: glycosyltransferase family 1 protein [Alphaproteobacteria bacterium]
MRPVPGRRAPRLLFTVNDAAFFVSHRLPIARAAAAAGYDVHVATAPGAAVSEIVSAGLIHHRVPLSRSGLNPGAEIRTFLALATLFRRLRPDLVHLVTIKPVIYGGLAARLTRCPAVVSAVPGLGSLFVARGVSAAVLRAGATFAYRLALGHRHGRVIFQNPDDRDWFIGRGLVKRDRWVLIKGSGVDMARFAPMPEPPESLGPPVVVLPARMLRDKGVAEFVAAARALRARGVAARFVLVGASDPGNPTAIPESDLRAWHAEGTVEWHGPAADMPAVLAGAHIVCLPSYREGLPKSLIEAAACARPIVATDVPGCREIARHGENALLVPPRDAAALAEALARLIAEPALRRRLGARGRAIAEAEFALDSVIDQTLALYRTLLDPHSHIVAARFPASCPHEREPS